MERLCEQKAKARREEDLEITFSTAWVSSSSAKKQTKLEKLVLSSLDDEEDYEAFRASVMNMAAKKRREFIAIIVSKIQKVQGEEEQNKGNTEVAEVRVRQVQKSLSRLMLDGDRAIERGPSSWGPD